MNDKNTPAATNPSDAESIGNFKPRRVSPETLDGLEDVANEVGGAYQSQPEAEGAVAFTHFDSPSSADNAVTVLLTKENMDKLPSQSLVRIKSLKDDGSIDRCYIAVVVAGPFAEPDGLRADSPIVVTTTVQGKIFLPRYHGRALIEILGEEADSQVIPPRYRPRPNSPVFVLDAQETAKALKVGGDARLGLVVGQEEIVVGIPTDKMSVLPRHTGILGTTGGGKSTTVSELVNQLQKANVATILLDVEPEYTEIDQPTDDLQMLTALRRRGLKAGGISNLKIFHLVGRDTGRQGPNGDVKSFCLRFSELSPYAVMEILDLNTAQQERFYKAYDATRAVLKDLKIFPSNKDEESILLELDELETGYPRLTLSYLLDIAGIIRHKVAKEAADPQPFNQILRDNLKKVQQRTAQIETSHELSWLALMGRLGRINRLKIFDNPKAPPITYSDLLKAGQVSVIDLSDTDSPQVRNLVIADILRGVQRAQEVNVAEAAADGKKPTPVVVIIEEAHEFLSAHRIKQMPVLFEQVTKIAKRGRKRWLGLIFVTQLPQHLPDEVFGLINNFVLHKISDGGVVDRLKKCISGIDKSQWNLLPGLAPGQALVSLTSMARPLLVSIDPTPCKLRYIE
jgi:DNA helicase HerA-like ATPase